MKRKQIFSNPLLQEDEWIYRKAIREQEDKDVPTQEETAKFPIASSEFDKIIPAVDRHLSIHRRLFKLQSWRKRLLSVFSIFLAMLFTSFAIAYAFSEDIRVSTNNFVITLLGGEYVRGIKEPEKDTRYAPQLPERYKIVDTQMSSNEWIFTYSDGNQTIIFTQVLHPDMEQEVFNGEYVNAEELIVQGTKAFYTWDERVGISYLMWGTTPLFKLEGAVDKDTIIAYAESVHSTKESEELS